MMTCCFWLLPFLHHGNYADLTARWFVVAHTCGFTIRRWELVTRQDPWGQIPYKNPFSFRRDLEVAVLSGQRPELFPEFVWSGRYTEMMQLCWKSRPDERPTFERVVDALGDELHSSTNV